MRHNISLQRTSAFGLAAELGSFGGSILHWLIVVAIGFAGSAAADSLVVVGAGSPGTWTTQLALANASSEPVTVAVYPAESHIPLGACLPSCPIYFVPIAANGSSEISVAGSSLDSPSLITLFVTLIDGPTLPTVRAQEVSTDGLGRRVNVPVLLLSTLIQRGSKQLVFPGVTRNATEYSNLAIGAVAADGSTPRFTARFEIWSSDGVRLATGTFSNDDFFDFGTGTNIVVCDVVGRLGVPALSNGQVRVTQLTGDGVLWGAMATLGGDGGIIMTEGLNP